MTLNLIDLNLLLEKSCLKIVRAASYVYLGLIYQAHVFLFHQKSFWSENFFLNFNGTINSFCHGIFHFIIVSSNFMSFMLNRQVQHLRSGLQVEDCTSDLIYVESMNSKKLPKTNERIFLNFKNLPKENIWLK